MFALSKEAVEGRERTWYKQLPPSEEEFMFVKASTLQISDDEVFIF